MIEIQGAYNKAIVYADSVDNAVRGQLSALCNSPAMDGTQIRVMTIPRINWLGLMAS